MAVMVTFTPFPWFILVSRRRKPARYIEATGRCEPSMDGHPANGKSNEFWVIAENRWEL